MLSSVCNYLRDSLGAIDNDTFSNKEGFDTSSANAKSLSRFVYDKLKCESPQNERVADEKLLILRYSNTGNPLKDGFDVLDNGLKILKAQQVESRAKAKEFLEEMRRNTEALKAEVAQEKATKAREEAKNSWF